VHYRSLIIGFTIIISLSVTLSILALLQLITIAEKVDDIYQHPFAVSNAGQTIESRILAMHRDMKDVVLVKNQADIPLILARIGQHEQEVLSQFTIIFDRFLGDKSQISNTYQLFLDWRPIRNEVLTLHALGKHEAAAQVTRERGAEHVEQLQSEVSAFVNFAKEKAQEFHEVATLEKRNAIVMLSVLSSVTFLLSVFIAVVVVRAKRTSEQNFAQQSHLIDQNIMLASLDLDGNITQASNALCRFLHSTQDKLIGSQSNFFINSEDKNNDVPHIWRLLQTGKSWEGEIFCKDADGARHFAYSTLVPVFDEQFKIVSYSNIIQDSTDKKLSITDALTTLPNRRSFDETFSLLLQEAKREKIAVALAILDVDHFKLFNDNYGHQAGDDALSQIGQCLQASMQREGEYVFRIGGEEFAIVLVEQSAEQVKNELERIRRNIEELHIVHEHNSASQYLTLSIGGCIAECASLSTNELSKLHNCALYTEADKALYLAKNIRNTVMINSYTHPNDDDENRHTPVSGQAA